MRNKIGFGHASVTVDGGTDTPTATLLNDRQAASHRSATGRQRSVDFERMLKGWLVVRATR